MKFTYSFANNRVYCMTYYAGKTIKGVSKRHPDDEFNLEDGKKLAKARCEYKVRKKQFNNKLKRCVTAHNQLSAAAKIAENATRSVEFATKQLEEARLALEAIENSLR